MTNMDNPASRLLLILEEGKKKNVHQACLTVWQELLHTEGDLSLTLSRLGKCMNLPEQIIQTLLDLYPNHSNVWSHWESKITNAFEGQAINGQWNSFIQHIDANSLIMLKMTETIIESKLKTKFIDLENISDIRASLDNLLNEVVDSDVSDGLKIFIVRKIRELITCIDEYKLTGLMPVLDAVDSAIGHAVTNSEYNEFLKKQPLGEKLKTILGDITNVVTTASGIASITTEIFKLLSN
ncbi:MAG: hypothetical protein ACRCV6_01880 [Formosimonas sp.]